MDLSVQGPDTGAGGGASAPAPIHLPPEKAKDFFENFQRGAFTVILLGDAEEQRLHWVKPSEEEQKQKIRGHMELCTADFGSCHHCRARLAGGVLIQASQLYHFAPAYVRKGERGDFEQKVVTLTDGMRKQLCALLGASGWRGHRFTLKRISTQKYDIQVAAKSQTPAHKLPSPFDVAPFVRARFELPQHPSAPLVFLPNYSHRDLTSTQPEKSRALGLTAEDCISSEERAKKAEELAAMKAKLRAAAGGAAPAAVARPEPPAVRPEPVAPTAAAPVEDKPTESEVIRAAANGTAYGPKTRVAGPGMMTAAAHKRVGLRIDPPKPSPAAVEVARFGDIAGYIAGRAQSAEGEKGGSK